MSEFIHKTFPELCHPYNYVPSIIGAKRRIIVFGDIHGDSKLALKMFFISGLVCADTYKRKHKLKWIGGDTYVVQVGDQIDKCRPTLYASCHDKNTTHNDEGSDAKILKLFNYLNHQALKHGGAVISLLGNHEIMNAMGYMGYVSHMGMREFDTYIDKKDPSKIFNSGQEARVHAFKPGNEYGVMLGCTRVPAIIIGSNLFVHAGIIDALINEISLNGIQDLERINIKIRKWLLGLLDEKYVGNIIRQSNTSMFWTRILGKIEPNMSLDNPDCSNNISKVLKLFNIGSMIIGHTPQSFLYSDDINSTCSNKIWRVDNGSSSAFDYLDKEYTLTGKSQRSRRVQYLEIINDNEFYVCDSDECKKKIL